MVGIMAANWRDKAGNLLHFVKTSPDAAVRVERLRQLKQVLLHREPALLPEFVPLLAELHADQPSPVRRALSETMGDIGSKHVKFLPDIVPTLISLLKDDAPAVARQTITSGTVLFRTTLEKVAFQGLQSNELDNSMELSWFWMLNFKDAVFPIAFQPGSDGARLLAIKFVEALILLYTPDPNSSSDPPQSAVEGIVFNVSWLRGGHPILKAGDLSTVASHSLSHLLDQLRSPHVKSLSNSITIVLVNSLSAIAQKRPSFYGRILPVLLALDPRSSVINAMEVAVAFHALKNAFVAFLKCTHPSATPWHARVVEALEAMNNADLVDKAVTADSFGCVIPLANVPAVKTCIDANGEMGRKRIKIEEIDDLTENEDLSNKRVKISSVATEQSHENPSRIHDSHPSSGSVSCSEGDDGPVQQLIGVLGALVSQGEKAVDSLNVLISSISSDLLAEVVMANMRHFPCISPKTEEEEDSDIQTASLSGLVGKDNLSAATSSFVSDILSLSKTLSFMNAQLIKSHDTSNVYTKDDMRTDIFVDANLSTLYRTTEGASSPPAVAAIPKLENSSVISLAEGVSVEDSIPGLGSPDHFDSSAQESLDASHSSTAELQGELVVSSGNALLDTNSSGSVPSYISEIVTGPTASLDAGEYPSTSNSYVFSSSQICLPKMTAPVVDLTDEQKDHLQKVAFMRIIDTHKQIEVAGGIKILFPLLASLSAESPAELDFLDLVQKHILSDYIIHEGNELVLHVLYKLFRESEQDQDFFSSTTATENYEKFLTVLSENLRDLLPASDKSLSRLLGEVPYLPKTILKLLERLCCPEDDEKIDKDLQSGDRVTQGLSAIWSLILLRPPNRDDCLKVALQSAAHRSEEVRMKAIRLVANKLFPLSCITQKIEDYSSDMLLSVNRVCISMTSYIEGATTGLAKGTETEGSHMSLITGETSSDTRHLDLVENLSSSLLSDAQRRMSLYFALCTKKHSLLVQLFSVYKNMPEAAKQAVHRHIPILVRTTGASSVLLSIISDPPEGSGTLLMQVLNTLTDGATPSSELISSIKRAYDTKMKDVEILFPILPFLPKEEVLSTFPQLVNLSPEKFQVALSRMLLGSPQIRPSLTPEEVLIALHGVDPLKEGIALKKVMDACTSCFEQRLVFTQQVLAKVLNQLVEQIPLPLLFMRTVIQAVGTFPALVDFVMEILSRLVNKQIWKYPKLWVGFVKCVIQLKPQSFNVLLQLPAAQLENALNRNPTIRAPLVEHASQSNICPTLPRSILAVLGLVSDSQASGPSQPQTSEGQIADTSNSTADISVEKTQDPTVAN